MEGATNETSKVLLGKKERVHLDARLILDPRRTALLIIDMQYLCACRTTGMGKKFAEDGLASVGAWRFDRIEQTVVPNMQKLLAFFRENGLKVAYVRVGSQTGDFSDIATHIRPFAQDHNARSSAMEFEILKEIGPKDGEVVMTKSTISAFASTGLDQYLRLCGIEHLLLTGVGTCACVDTNGRAAADLGYHCVLVEDACSDIRKEDHEWAVANFQKMWGRVESTDLVLSELGRGLRATAEK